MKVPVVVLNMHYSGLGIARSLGPHGVPVYGLSSDPDFPGNFSRYCQFRLSPDSLHEPERLRDFLMDFAGTLDARPILLPTRDHDIEFLVTHREVLEQRFTIPLASREVIEQATNKDKCLALAADCGIPVPRSHTIGSLAEFEALPGGLTFPVIVKPLYARHWRRPGIWETVGHQKAALLESAEELSRFYRAIEPTAPLATIQEYIPGPDSSLVIFGSYCRPGGEVRAYFTGRKLLQDPPLKGTGLIVEGVPIPEIVPHEQGIAQGARLLGHLRDRVQDPRADRRRLPDRDQSPALGPALPRHRLRREPEPRAVPRSHRARPARPRGRRRSLVLPGSSLEPCAGSPSGTCCSTRCAAAPSACGALARPAQRARNPDVLGPQQRRSRPGPKTVPEHDSRAGADRAAVVRLESRVLRPSLVARHPDCS